MISSKDYYEENYFSEEMKKVFSANWLFVGMENELQNNNDFITINIGPNAIVVQNFRGSVKAFQNICLHRFNKIQTGKKGNRPFFCSYHAWGYNQDGQAMVSSKFKDECELEDLKLKSYPVEKCGAFYFVNPSGNEVSLSEFLGEYFSVLANFSTNFGKEIFNGEIVHEANWKLLIENVLECYHCRTVHSETFIPMGIGSLPALNFKYSQKHNDCEYPKKESEKLQIKGNKLSFLQYRKLQHSSYHHIYIYPNLFVSSTEGNVFYVGALIPISAGRTELQVRIYSPILELSSEVKVNNYLFEAFSEAAKESTLKVLQEDKFILENIQEVISKIERKPIFGKEEFRIEHFYQHYLEDINT